MNELKLAIKKRDEFLEKNPHMKKFQAELDEILNKSEPEKRLEVITLMLTGKLVELQQTISDFTNIV